MISHLKGVVESIEDNSIVVDVNGVGYNVICSTRTSNYAKNCNAIVRVFTSLVVREDAWILYGFINKQEREWFGILTSVQGVGGKAAISILSAVNESDLYNIFLNSDKDMLMRADGVGPKLAARIISELREKIIGKVELRNALPMEAVDNGVVSDVMSALVNLGYQKSDVVRVFANYCADKENNFDDLLKQMLKKLASGG